MDGESERFGRYAEAVVSEAAARSEEIRATRPEDCFSQKVDTLYIGGGTRRCFLLMFCPIS